MHAFVPSHHSFLAAGNKRPRGVMQSSKVNVAPCKNLPRGITARPGTPSGAQNHGTEVPNSILPDVHGDVVGA